MTRFNTEIDAVDAEGKAVDMTAQGAAAAGAGDPSKYKTIKPDYYHAVISKIEQGHYLGKWGQFPNPDREGGKWNYEKIIPTFTILNENGTEISRQDFTLGVFEKGKFVRPDGKVQSPFMTGTQYLLTALGLFEANPNDPTKFKFEANFDLIKDRVVRVRTGIAGYIVTPKLNLDEGQFTELMIAISGTDKYTYEQIPELVARFNEASADEITVWLGKVSKLYNAPLPNDLVAARDGEGHDKAMLKTKNVISSVYAIKEEDAAANGWFYDQLTGGVFTVAAAWEAYMVDNEMDKNYKEPNM